MNNSQWIYHDESARELAKRLNLSYTDYHLLRRALTHRSYLNEHPEALEDNERLEFLGDAVLDFLVGAWLYNRFPEMAEGQLTRLRSALVRTEQLAEFSRQLNLAAAMRLGRGEIESGGRSRSALLCATFEAVVGSLYLDGGIDQVKSFVEPLLDEATEVILIRGELQDPKSLLQEWTQARGLGAPKYHTIASTGPDHAKVFKIEVAINGQIWGKGEGTSKQIAAKAAARAALKALDLI
ncbi:MAG: ribonuclease III [Anaerolineales bacterium]|jgi:ribonuclease-3